MSDNTMRELFPCPFCGGSDLFAERKDLSETVIVCNDCGGLGPGGCPENDNDLAREEEGDMHPGELMAHRRWNTRQSQQAQTVDVKALIAEYEAAHEDEAWEHPHPIFLMAQEIDALQRQSQQGLSEVEKDGVTPPRSVEQAELMQKVGYAWLRDNAPERLVQEAQGEALTTGEILTLERRSPMTHDEAIRFARSVESVVLRKAAPAAVPEGMDGPWPLRDCISKLCEAADILLHNKDYDGHGHEEIATARDTARRLLSAPALAEPAPAAVPEDLMQAARDFVEMFECVFSNDWDWSWEVISELMGGDDRDFISAEIGNWQNRDGLIRAYHALDNALESAAPAPAKTENWLTEEARRAAAKTEGWPQWQKDLCRQNPYPCGASTPASTEPEGGKTNV